MYHILAQHELWPTARRFARHSLRNLNQMSLAMPTTHLVAISKLVAQTWARNEFEARLTGLTLPLPRTAIRWFVLFFSTRSAAAVREASAAAELIMISPRPPLRSTPHVERRRLIRISGNCRRPTAEGGERIVNHAAGEGFFVVPFNLWLRVRATVKKYSEREQVLKSI